MLLSLVLGDLLEQAMRQSLTIADGSPAIFFTRPISLTLLIMAGLFMLWPIFQRRAERKLAKEQAA
jgi:putative tricarboxylic transport membrane protein